MLDWTAARPGMLDRLQFGVYVSQDTTVSVDAYGYVYLGVCGNRRETFNRIAI